MKKIFFLFCLLFAFNSCKKKPDPPDPIKNQPDPPGAILNTNFNHKILEGYFVDAIAFDHLGNAWIGTLNKGLIKYNSEGVEIFNSTNSIISDTEAIYALAVDSKNNVWIGTLSKGLIKFDGESFKVYNSSNSPIPENRVVSIAIDSKDNVWFASNISNHGGVVKYDGLTWKVFTPDNSPMPVNLVPSITIDKNDNVWMAFWSGLDRAVLAKLSESNWNLYYPKDLGYSPNYFLHGSSIKTNSKNQLCGVTCQGSVLNQPVGFVFDGNTFKILQNETFKNVGMETIAIDNQDRIWGGCHDGYTVYDGTKWVDGLDVQSIYSIAQAPDGKMWIGTVTGIYIGSAD